MRESKQSMKDDRAGDEGATISQDPEGSRHGMKITGGVEGEEDRPDTIQRG